MKGWPKRERHSEKVRLWLHICVEVEREQHKVAGDRFYSTLPWKMSPEVFLRPRRMGWGLKRLGKVETCIVQHSPDKSQVAPEHLKCG